jgi:phosphoserine/homoserine phosphotransferase
MLQAAERGFLFRPPANVVDEYPQFPVTTAYSELKPLVANALAE